MTTPSPSDLIEEVARAIMESNMRDTHLRLHKKGETWIFPADAWPKMVEENWNDAEVRGEALNSARAAAAVIIEACAEVACCNYGGFAIDTQYGDGYQRACVNIADAIRALAPKPEGEPDAQICASDDGDEMCDRCDCWKHTRALCG